jgi:hypothetical protein
MKATVLHDQNGHIIGISKVIDAKVAGPKAIEASIIPGNGQFMLDIDLSHEHAAIRLLDIQKHYRVDRDKSELVKR